MDLSLPKRALYQAELYPVDAVEGLVREALFTLSYSGR